MSLLLGRREVLAARHPPSGPMPDAGLTPDVLVRTTPQSVATGRDPQMEAAIARLS